MLNNHDKDEDAEGVDVLDTPGAGDRRKWGDVPEASTGTAATGATSLSSKRTTKGGASTGKGVTLTLRDQEKHIDNLKKENFNIKLRVHFLEERLAQLAPDQIDAALKQNINLKIEVQQRGMEIKKLKKLVLSLEHELERSQRNGSGGNRDRERELEEKLEEREMELRELRAQRRKGAHGGVDEEVVRELEARNAELEDELDNAKGLIEDNMDEIDRLKDLVERRGADESADSSMSESRRGRIARRLEELENDNEDLGAKLTDTADLLAQREEEKEDLMDEEREEREAVEEDLNAMRDRMAALMIELQSKEEEVEERGREIEELVKEHKRIVDVVEEEWRGEVEETRGQVEELKDVGIILFYFFYFLSFSSENPLLISYFLQVLAEREAESKDLRLNISELESNTNDLHTKFEAALAHLESESDQKDAELDRLQETIDKLGEQIYELEDENDRIKEDMERVLRESAERDVRDEEERAERERLEALVGALKEVKELASHIEDLVSELSRERSAREQAESDLDAAEREHDASLRSHKRTLEAKESALASALADLARTQSLLAQREADLRDVQSALQAVEEESKKAGESHTTARFSLQLEADRLKRDLERVEDELTRLRKELDDRESKYRDRDSALDKLHSENRDLASQLAAQTQARLNLSEKLDVVQGNLRSAEGEVGVYKSKVGELEARLSKDQRALLGAEAQYRDQLTERNTLLLTIYQYLDKILGVDKTPTKPFTNFSVFHDNLITRLKALSQIQTDFEKKCKDVEAKFAEKLGDMKKQLDNRWKQIDKFEASVKTYADTKQAWKKKYAQKEGELEAVKATNVELSSQLSSIKRPGEGASMEVRALAARAANAERRLNNAQNQLLSTEEKIAAINQKNAQADNKWEARVKEYEARLKAAEERVKRERQGSKERVGELENNVKSLQRQLELAQKRNSQLNDVMVSNKGSGSSSPVVR
ncbi:hypothetical protein CPB84DRAFT_1741356 [Gymnopilus junonius]|uniref:Centrosomin N-terminal motif 1 domain-containing protein n=1 Tax=Gymnopilus junonius TaxID=109634 RepID=A0A9P5N6Z0_GYMJU|nr:hypothetical protein CPB84DRAFT_1741356 [Gymnopilus junonius]